VVVADARSGRRVAAMAVGAPFPPFYYMWSACGTRLLFLRRAREGEGGCCCCSARDAGLEPKSQARRGRARQPAEFLLPAESLA
jgi:hypothetical protein